MVKFSNSSFDQYRQNEQYENCSVMIPDNQPLEDLDPAILSCGLPAIVLGGQRNFARIQYTSAQLKAMNGSPLSHLRPAIIDDPIVGRFFFWKNGIQSPYVNNPRTVIPPYKGREDNYRRPIHQQVNIQDKDSQALNPRSYDNDERHYKKYDFVNGFRKHHVIVKSYKEGRNSFLDTELTNEDEPEWFSGGPTSRLDTIELKGFDDDPAEDDDKTTDQKSAGTGKRISFFDDISSSSSRHARHSRVKLRDELSNTPYKKYTWKETMEIMRAVSTRAFINPTTDEQDNVTVSPGSVVKNSPPARSTPTKITEGVAELALDDDKDDKDGEDVKVDPMPNHPESFNNNNSISGSRFSKYFRKGGDVRRQDGLPPFRPANTESSKFMAERKPDEPNALENWIRMFSQNSNMLVAQQQQYLSQMLNKTQQSDSLKKMLHLNDEAPAPGSPPSRLPTQQELQFHTQSIMQTAILRKRLMDQYRVCSERPIPAVQQLISSVHSNLQKKFIQNGGFAGQYSHYGKPPNNRRWYQKRRSSYQNNNNNNNNVKKAPENEGANKPEKKNVSPAPSATSSIPDLSRWFSEDLLAKASAGELPKVEHLK